MDAQSAFVCRSNTTSRFTDRQLGFFYEFSSAISSPQLNAAAASAGAVNREELDKKQRGRAGIVLHSFSVCGVCEGFGGFFLSQKVL